MFLIWSSFLLICCRRLRDRFIEAERLSLAMEVSTKCGLDPSGVWGAAGFALLQAGDFPGAREKFARCMKVNDWLQLDFKFYPKKNITITWKDNENKREPTGFSFCVHGKKKKKIRVQMSTGTRFLSCDQIKLCYSRW